MLYNINVVGVYPTNNRTYSAIAPSPCERTCRPLGPVGLYGGGGFSIGECMLFGTMFITTMVFSIIERKENEVVIHFPVCVANVFQPWVLHRALPILL